MPRLWPIPMSSSRLAGVITLLAVIAVVAAFAVQDRAAKDTSTAGPGPAAQDATAPPPAHEAPSGEATALADTARATAPTAAKPAGGDSGAGNGSSIGASPVDLGIKVIKSGEISLDVRGAAFDDAMQEVAAIARGAGGYVAATQLADGRRQRATLTLRVPARRIEAAMRELGGVGTVRMRALNGDDVTQEYVDTESRLRHSRAVEQRLLDLLARAESVSDTLLVGDRLAQVQQQIEIDQGRINQLDQLTSMATITVSLREKVATADDGRNGLGVGAALRDAGEAFVEKVNAGIVWLGGAAPALLLVGVGLIVARRWWRR